MPERIMDVTPDAVAAMLRAGAADLLVHGHTHRPAVHQLQVDGRNATRIVLGDWYEQGSALAIYTDARHETLALPMRGVGSTLNMAASNSRV
jgi:UDP-2,3-diacylglucosamine hydrolase